MVIAATTVTRPIAEASGMNGAQLPATALVINSDGLTPQTRYTLPPPAPIAFGYSSMREPMMTVLARGSLKYSAASAVSRAVAMNRRLRQRLMPGEFPMRTSMVDRK
jgi:hypothetical protein